MLKAGGAMKILKRLPLRRRIALFVGLPVLLLVVAQIGHVRQFAQTIRLTMEEQSVGSQQVSSALQDINLTTQAIRHSSEEMSQSIRSVQGEMRIVERVSQQILDLTGVVSRSADSIHGVAGTVLASSQSTGLAIEALGTEVKRFVI